MLAPAGASTANEPELDPSSLTSVTLEVAQAFLGTPPFDRPRTIRLPPGFRIAVYAANTGSTRQLAFSPRGVLFSASIWDGRVLAHPDRNGDGVSDAAETVVFASGLWAPHSLAWDGPDLYVGAHDRILRFRDADGDLAPDGEPATVALLPTFGDQITRTVVLGPDRRLYVGVGSTTNADPETDPRRGAILRFALDGSGETTYARGLRNPVGLAFHPDTGQLWTTEVGADHLGEDCPREELDLVQADGHYGWPYCYEDRVPDAGLYPSEAPAFCPRTLPPLATLPAHTTPLGLSFYDADSFPAEYRGRAFVALHGSSKRVMQAGYAVVTVRGGVGGPPATVEPFAAGWLLDPAGRPNEPEQHWGRPVHAIPGPDGALYISSDSPGAIYRVRYQP